MLELTIQKIGQSLGIILPREVLNRLRVKDGDGDKVILIEAPDGSYRITPYDPEFEKQIRLTEEGMHRYRQTLGELAQKKYLN